MPKKQHDPALLAEARRLYEQTLAPVDDIAGMLGISNASFYRRVSDGGWRGRRAKVATFEFTRALSGEAIAKLLPEPVDQPRADIAAAPQGPTEQQRLALARKFHEAVAEQIDAIKRIARIINPADQSEIDKLARATACVSRSLREIQALTKPDNEAPADEDAADDSTPRDLDEFRNELARRIRGIIEARRAGLHGRLDGPVLDDELG